MSLVGRRLLSTGRKYGGYIGNPNKELRGKKAMRAKMSPEDRTKKQKLKARRSFPEHELRPFVRFTAVVHTNGATSAVPYMHPAGWPVVRLTSDTHNNPLWAAPDEIEAMQQRLVEEKESKGEDEFLKGLFTSKGRDLKS